MRVGAEYQARIPDFEPGKSLFGCNLTSCRRRSRGGRDGFGAGVGSAGRSPGGGRGVVFILLSSLCVGDPVPAAGGWQGQRLLSVRPGAGGGGHRGGKFSLHYQPYYVSPAGGGEAERGRCFFFVVFFFSS